MARATAQPIPSMANADEGSATTPRTKAGSAKSGSAKAGAGAKGKRTLGGAWGASFEG